MPQLEAADLIRKTIEDNVALMGDKIKEVQTSEGEERAKLVEQLDTLKKQVDGLTSELAEANSRPNFSGIETTRTGEKNKFSMGRFVKLVTGAAKPGQTGFDKEFGYELEVIKIGQEMQDTAAIPDQMKTAINAATDGAGGFLIPTELISEIIPELEAMEVAGQAGTTFINGMVGNVSWAVDNGGITAVYVDSEAEESASESVPTFSNLQITPHVAVAVVPLTWSMVAQPAVAMESYVQKRIGRKLALREDLSFFSGTGSNAQPTGLFNKAGISSVTMAASTKKNWGQGSAVASTEQPIVDEDFLALIEQVASADGIMPGGKFAFVTGQKVLANLGIAKGTDNKLLFREPNAAVPATMVGYPIFGSTQLNGASNTTHQIAFGDFSETIIARWGVMSFSSSTETETNFRKLRTSIRGVSAHDVAVFQTGSFAKGTFDLTNLKFK